MISSDAASGLPTFQRRKQERGTRSGILAMNIPRREVVLYSSRAAALLPRRCREYSTISIAFEHLIRNIDPEGHPGGKEGLIGDDHWLVIGFR